VRPSSEGNRSFRVGETVHLLARVSKPGTRTPTDAQVVVVRVARNDVPVAISDPDFLRVAEGDYVKVLPTVGLEPGTYHVRVRISDGEQAVVLAEDTFVLGA
jgi:hypothetical protein